MPSRVRQILSIVLGSCLGSLFALTIFVMLLSVEPNIASVRYWAAHGIVVTLIVAVATACLRDLQRDQELKCKEEKFDASPSNESTPNKQVDERNELPFNDVKYPPPILPVQWEHLSAISSAAIEESQYRSSQDLASALLSSTGTAEQQSIRKQAPKQQDTENVSKKKKKNKKPKVCVTFDMSFRKLLTLH